MFVARRGASIVLLAVAACSTAGGGAATTSDDSSDDSSGDDSDDSSGDDTSAGAAGKATATKGGSSAANGGSSIEAGASDVGGSTTFPMNGGSGGAVAGAAGSTVIAGSGGAPTNDGGSPDTAGSPDVGGASGDDAGGTEAGGSDVGGASGDDGGPGGNPTASCTPPQQGNATGVCCDPLPTPADCISTCVLDATVTPPTASAGCGNAPTINGKAISVNYGFGEANGGLFITFQICQSSGRPFQVLDGSDQLGELASVELDAATLNAIGTQQESFAKTPLGDVASSTACKTVSFVLRDASIQLFDPCKTAPTELHRQLMTSDGSTFPGRWYVTANGVVSEIENGQPDVQNIGTGVEKVTICTVK